MNRLFSIVAALLAVWPSWLHVLAEPGRLHLLPAELQERASGEDLSFCYGSGSICAVSNEFFDVCSALMDDYENLDPWYTCVCSSGYVAIQDACYFCQMAYRLSPSWNGPQFTSACAEIGVTIAPIPASVLSQESRYNETYTGVISGAVSTTGTGSAATATSDDDGTTATTTRNSISTSTPKSTFFVGTTAVETFDGGNIPQTTRTPTTTSRSASAQTTTTGAGVGTGVASRESATAYLAVTIIALGLSLAW